MAAGHRQDRVLDRLQLGEGRREGAEEEADVARKAGAPAVSKAASASASSSGVPSSQVDRPERFVTLVGRGDQAQPFGGQLDCRADLEPLGGARIEVVHVEVAVQVSGRIDLAGQRRDATADDQAVAHGARVDQVAVGSGAAVARGSGR